MTDLASKIFATYSTILYLSKEEILQVGHNTNDARPIPSFDQELLMSLCSEAQTIFSKEDVVLEIDGDVVVVGDIHGSLHDLLRILNYINVNQYKILFLGDYVDRGSFSLECISLLFSLKILFPDQYFLLRGNHEFDAVCAQYGFRKEIAPFCIQKGISLPKFNKFSPDSGEPLFDEDEIDVPIYKEDSFHPYISNHRPLRNYQYNESLYEAFMKAFSYLPICAIINKTSICIHGGISPQLKKIDDIRNFIHRPIDHFDDNQLLSDILWSDPSKRPAVISQGFEDNPRGCGKLFSLESISDFLRGNFLKRLIRGHECINNGIEMRFNDMCVTVFSASSYNKDMGNKSAILKVLKRGDQIEPIVFHPIPQLNRLDANFFKVQPHFEKATVKPVFTMSPTVRQPPILQAKSEQLLNFNRDNLLKETANISVSPGNTTPLKSTNACPIMAPNRTKPRLLAKNVRSVNGSFAFNTGIRHKRQNSGRCLNSPPNGLAHPKVCAEYQSDDQALIEVENMGRVEDDQEVPQTKPKVLPKLITK